MLDLEIAIGDGLSTGCIVSWVSLRSVTDLYYHMVSWSHGVISETAKWMEQIVAGVRAILETITGSGMLIYCVRDLKQREAIVCSNQRSLKVRKKNLWRTCHIEYPICGSSFRAKVHTWLTGLRGRDLDHSDETPSPNNYEIW